MPTTRLGLVLLTAYLFHIHIATGSPDSVWQVHIANGPAPPVQDEPPFSRHASRDRSLLKYQIPGIIGGYIGFVLIIGFALLTFGRRYRRIAQAYDGKRPVEMVQTLKPTNFESSPVSPSQSFRSWRKWGHGKSGADGSTKSPQVHGTPTFDAGVIDADRARREQEMERLYAAVMAQNTKAPRSLGVQEKDFGMSKNVYAANQSHRFIPPELAHLDTAVEALYPPYAPTLNDLKASSPSVMSDITSTSSPYTNTPAAAKPSHAVTPSGEQQYQHKSSLLTRGSRKRSSLRITTAPGSVERPTSTQIENDDVVSPIEDAAHEARTQLNSSRSSTNSRRPLTPFPHFFTNRTESREQNNTSPATDFVESYNYAQSSTDETFDVARPLPSEAPHRPLSSSSVPGSEGQTYYNPISRFQAHSTANSSTRTLPLRMPSPNTAIAQISGVSASSPSATAVIAAGSPTPTRTTFLTPRQDHFNHNTHFHQHLTPGRNNTLPTNTNISSARLIAAGLATPYSPYMPFSPVTPVTPGLRTREQRLRDEREEGRWRRGVWKEEHEVRSERELWGDAWEGEE